MTIHKTKLQKHEYDIRIDTISDLRTSNMNRHQVIKNLQYKLKEMLEDNLSNVDKHRTGFALKNDEQKVLQRNGALVEYRQIYHKLNQSQDLYFSIERKINRLRSIDFPDW